MTKIGCFGYIRVSGMGQVEKDGPIRQEKAIRDYAEANNFKIEDIYRDEGISGTTENRQAFNEMLVALEKNKPKIQTVIIERIDRLARNLMVQETLITTLKKHEINLRSASENIDLLSDDPTRKIIRQVLGAFAEYDKTMIVNKLKTARERIKASGKKCEGRKSYREVKPELLAQIKRLRRKRKGLRPIPYSHIANKLNSDGLVTIAGQPFTGQNIQNIYLNHCR